MLTWTCDVCQCDSEGDPEGAREQNKANRVQWGCEEPTQIAVWEDEEDEYYSCPMHFIPQNVFDWYRDYWYTEFSGRGALYEERGRRWMDAAMYYQGMLKYWMDRKPRGGQKTEQQEQETRVEMKAAFAKTRK